MSVIIESLYIFDDTNQCLLEHIYRARPPAPQELISYFRSLPLPHPAITHLSSANPPTTVYSISHGNLRIRCTSSTDLASSAVLEFLYRVIDVFEDFLGSPLLPHKIEENYEVVGQLLAEICDGGVVCNTESNALRENVEVSTRLGKLFEQVGLPGSLPSSGPTNLAAALKAQSSQSAGPAIPWRRPNVRHTSNELYVDIVEMLSVVFAPSGRPLLARSNGSVRFTSKLSGVPDLLLQLQAPGGTSSAKSSGIARTMQAPTFHPCVRLARWKENPGEFSFVPPDGKFMLAGYEVDLLPSPLNNDQAPSQSERLFLPVTVDMKTGLGPSGTNFEARVTINTSFPGVQSMKPSGPPGRTTATTTPFSFSSGPASGSSSAPVLESVVVTIPFPADIRNVADFKPSRGDAAFKVAERAVEWKIPTKDGFSVNGTATLTGAVLGSIEYIDDGGNDDDDDDNSNDEEMEGFNRTENAKANNVAGYYDESSARESSTIARHTATISSTTRASSSKQSRADFNKKLMPRSIAVSFAVKGWLPSGIKVDSLTVNTKTSKGLGDGVRPYKGVKYLTVSRRGVERRL